MKQIAGKFALLIVSFGVALLVAELLSRAVTEALRTVHWTDPDARFGFRYPSNVDSLTNMWGDGAFWHFKTNARGFRGEDWPDEPTWGSVRVLVVGDSFTFGEAVKHEEAFPQVADTIVSADGEGWEIINLGVSAWSPSHAVAWLETEGRSIAASCLIFALFAGNDAMENSHGGLYVLQDGVLIYNHGEDQGIAERLKNAIRASPPFQYLRSRSQLFNLALLARVQLTANEGPVSPNREAFEEALVLNRALLDRLAALAHCRFGGFGLLVVPMRSMLSEEAPGDDLYPLWTGKATREDVLAWAVDARVPVLDLLEHLPREMDAVRSLFFRHDIHTNAKGNREIGRLLAEELPRLCASDNPRIGAAHSVAGVLWRGDRYGTQREE